MGLVTEKIIAILVIFTIEVLFTVFPVFCKKCRDSPRLISYASCFSSGLFICLVIFHILPHTSELYGEAMAKEGKTDSHDYFSWPNLACILSFSIVFLFDKVLFKKDKSHVYKETAQDQKDEKEMVRHSDLDECNSCNSKDKDRVIPVRN